MSVVPIIPHSPDLYVCDRAYGDLILFDDCTSAIGQLSNGQDNVNYYLNRPELEYHLPFSTTTGTCTITVEHAGPDLSAPQFIKLVPVDIKGMAEFVKRRCATYGIGGFTTDGFDSLVDYLENSGDRDLMYRPDQSHNMWFVTVSITGHSETNLKPGDTDPVVANALRGYAQEFLETHSDDIKLKEHFSETLERLLIRSWQMKRRGSLNWWSPQGASDEMTYTCDADLGSPALVDCAQIQWQGLGPPSDTITIVPGVTKFISQNTCNLAISAAVALTLTWSQIQTAFSTLMNTCVKNPIHSPQGGTAYFAPHPAFSGCGTKVRKDLTGLNALPPHANLTIFASNASSELNCEWQAARQGRSASSCK